MRFMVIVKADENSEAGVFPPEEVFAEMGKYNEELMKAGVLIVAEGLQPSSRGMRVKFSGDGDVIVTDGPFAETKELIAGFWILEVKSREELLEWVKRIPNPTREEYEVEVRQVFEEEDFGELAEKIPEVFETERKLRELAKARYL